MSGMWLVANREVVTRVRSKSFVIGLVVTVVFVLGISLLPRLTGDSSYTVALVGADAAPMAPVLTELAQQSGVVLEVRTVADEQAARADLHDGDLDAAMVSPDTVLVDAGVDLTLEQLLDAAYRSVTIEQRLQQAGIDPGPVAAALDIPPLQTVTVGEAVVDSQTRLLAMAVVILMFMLIYLPAVYVAMGVVEEKSSRIVELLLAAVRPSQLLAGKIIGIGLIAAVQLLVIAAAGLAGLGISGFNVQVPTGLGGMAATAALWFVLGYAFFATLAAAAGSLVSRQEDVNSVLTPVMLLMMGGYAAGFVAVFNPGSTLAQTLSMLPPFSTVVMPVRTVSMTVPWWQVATAVAAMVLATVVVLAVGARIYHRAVLRTGARVRLSEVSARQ